MQLNFIVAFKLKKKNKIYSIYSCLKWSTQKVIPNAKNDVKYNIPISDIPKWRLRGGERRDRILPKPISL